MWAAENGKPDTVKFLLDQTTEMTMREKNLETTIANNFLDIVVHLMTTSFDSFDILLKHMSDLNKVDSKSSSSSLLHQAAILGQLELIKFLLDKWG